MRCYLSPLRWREFCLSARVWCNVFAFSIPLYMTGWQHWRELSSQCSHILSPRSAAPVFWKTHNRKLQQRRRYPHLGPDVLIYARWPNRLAGGGVRTEGHRRKQLPHLYFIASMTVRSAYNALPFPFSCTSERPRPRGPARMDSVGICRNADRPWESDTGRGLFGVAWRENGGVESKVAWVNERITHIFHSLWKADKHEGKGMMGAKKRYISNSGTPEEVFKDVCLRR